MVQVFLESYREARMLFDSHGFTRKVILRPQRKNQGRVSYFSPLLDHRVPGDLRQDPGHAASSSPEPKIPRKWEARWKSMR